MAEVNQDAIAAARAAGYSDDEIVSHLAQSDKRFATAKEAGYSGKEIIGHLVGVPSEAPTKSAPEAATQALKGFGAGASSVAGGLGETAKLLGAQGAGDWLAGKAEGVMPADYTPASLSKDGVSAIPQKAAELAPSIGLDLVGMQAGKRIGSLFGAKGKIVGSALGALGTAAGQYLGNNVKNTAQEHGRDEPSTSDMVQGGLLTGAQALTNLVGLKGGIASKGAIASTGLRGVADSGVQLAKRAGVEAVSNTAQDLEGQLGTTAGSEQGMRVKDPSSLLESALTGGLAGAGFSAPRATRDMAGAVRERNITDAPAAKMFANRIVAHAGGLDELGSAISSKKDADATNRAIKDVHDELGTAAAANKNSLTPEAQSALSATKSGVRLNDRDFAAIDAAGDPALSNLARQSDVAADVGARGQLTKNSFVGGATAAATGLIRRHPIATLHTLGTGTAVAGIPAMLTHAAAAAPYLAGGYVLGRGLDHMTGARTPARSFAEKFADGGDTRVAPAAAPQPQAGPTQGAFTGGAPVPPGQGPWGRAPQPTTVPNVAAAPAPQPGIAQPPSGFQALLNAAVMTINKGQKQQDQQTVLQAMPLIKQLAAQNGPKQQASIDKMSAGIDQGIAALVQQRPQAPLGLPAPSPAMPMGAPAPQLALPAPQRANLPAVLPRVPGQPPMTPPPAVINLSGAPGAPPAAPAPQPQAAPAALAPVPSRQAAEVYQRMALAKQIADLHNEEVRRARVQAALSNAPQVAAKAPAKPAPAAPAPAPEPKASPLVEAMKPSAVDDGGIPDFLKRTRDEPKGPLAEAMTKKTLLETAFKDEPVETGPYTGFKHDLGNGKTFAMLPPHKEFVNAHTLTVPEIVKQITTRRNDAGELMFPSRRYADAIRPRIQGKRDLAYALADVVGVPKQELDKHLQAIPPSDKKGAERELQRIKDTWPKKAKQIEKVLQTSGLNDQDALTLWGRLKSDK